MLSANEKIPQQLQALSRLGNQQSIRTIAITGGKGGIGKSNIALNLAIAQAISSRQVLLFDADLGLANIDVLLGLKVKKTINDLLDKQACLDDLVINGPESIKIIPASSGIQRMTQLSLSEKHGLIQSFASLPYAFDTLIIDTAAGISDAVTFFSQAANDVIIVVCNEPTSLTDAYALIKLMSQQYQTSRFHIIANMVDNGLDGHQLFMRLCNATEHFLNVSLNYLGAIPFDDLLRKSVQLQRPVLTQFPQSRSAIAFKQISRKINEKLQPAEQNGSIQFFLERLLSPSSQEATA